MGRLGIVFSSTTFELDATAFCEGECEVIEMGFVEDETKGEEEGDGVGATVPKSDLRGKVEGWEVGLNKKVWVYLCDRPETH